MSKKSLLPGILALSLIALALSVANAQSEETVRHFGFGASVVQQVQKPSEREYYPPFDLPSVFIPVTWSGGFRTEFEVGYWRYSSSTKWSKGGFSNLRGAVGVYFIGRRFSGSRLYWGPRFGVIRVSDWHENGQKESDSRTDWHVDLAFGAEYCLSPRFSLGGELRILYYRFGELSEARDMSRTLITAGALILLRFYP